MQVNFANWTERTHFLHAAFFANYRWSTQPKWKWCSVLSCCGLPGWVLGRNLEENVNFARFTVLWHGRTESKWQQMAIFLFFLYGWHDCDHSVLSPCVLGVDECRQHVSVWGFTHSSTFGSFVCGGRDCDHSLHVVIFSRYRWVPALSQGVQIHLLQCHEQFCVWRWLSSWLCSFNAMIVF